MTVQINNRQVVCPACAHAFEVKHGPRGSGAAYVQDWDHVPSQLIKVMAVWMSHTNLRDMPRTKVMARDMLNRYGDLGLTENAAGARISELLGLKVLKVKIAEDKDDPQHTRQAPEYMLDIDRAAQIINAGGRLK